jgi:hypothetical protein
VIEIETASSTGESGGLLRHDVPRSGTREMYVIKGTLYPAI